MDAKRWQRIEALYHEALARPQDGRFAFLLEACGDDVGLRAEVDALLNEPAPDDAFLAGPALIAAADVVAGALPGAMTGRVLSGYRLDSLLGAGGMGEVYRAHDVTLARQVAIKVLPSAFSADADRLARFEREARMLAALSHPNICAIHGVDEADGLRLLILELVEGESLSELLETSARRHARPPGLALERALNISRQIAEALEAAHDKGIIHRDLKPANVKVTPSGLVKVLDFGLAKTVGHDGSSPDLTHAPVTLAGEIGGLLLGTVAYMSPEQARGLPVDKRGDIWAFGCVLYEMLTGRAAFAGDTVSDTIAKILEREPDWTALPPATPDPIRHLLMRCLAKEQKRRLRDIGEARIAIDTLHDGAVPALQPPAAIPSPSSRVTRWLPWAALAALLAAVAVWEVARPRGSDDPLADARIVRLTNWEGNEEAVEISPDGKFIAFLSDLTGEFDIWLNQVGTNHFSNLTREMPALAPGGAIVRKLGFSGNGAEIWFNPESRKPLLLMPLTGGPARTLLGEGANTPAWSPDGRRLVYFGKPPDGADPMFIADRTGADARQLVEPHAGMKRNNPVWSADGEWIYFVSGSEPQDEMDIDIWRVRASGGSPERLTSMHAAANFLAPIDARTVLYTARAEDGSGPWLWALDVARKASRRLTLGVDQVTSVAASRDGQRVVATVANPSAALWRVPLLNDRLADESQAERYPLPAPTGRAMAPRFGDRVMFYLSGRGTSDGLWKVQDDRATEVWRDADGPLAEPAAVSPDASQLAVVVRRDGRRLLSILAADGTNSRTLARSIEVEGAAGQGAASWSPDGRWIVTGGRDARGPALFKIPVDDGPPERIVEGKWVNPVWSPKGDLIVYSGRSLVGRVALLAVRPDGTPVALPEVWVRPGGYRFRPDGSGLVYIPGIHAMDFWLLDVTALTTRPLTHLANAGLLRTFDITPDGTHIVFDRSHENSDIVLLDRGPR